MSKEQSSSFALIMNSKIEAYLNRWKNFPIEKTHSTLNKLLDLTMHTGSEVELRVKRDAIFGGDNDSNLPQEAMIYGKAGNEEDWVFTLPPDESHHDGSEPYQLFVYATDRRDNASSRLTFGQKSHSTIASFKPEDVLSIKIK